jgi:hypothetical protein
VSLGEGFLKGFHFFAAPSEKPSTFNDLPQLLKFVFTDLPLLRQRSFPDRLTAVNCQPFRHRTSPHFEFSDWLMPLPLAKGFSRFCPSEPIKMTQTMMRVPLMHGAPWQTFGSTEMRSLQSSILFHLALPF